MRGAVGAGDAEGEEQRAVADDERVVGAGRGRQRGGQRVGEVRGAARQRDGVETGGWVGGDGLCGRGAVDGDGGVGGGGPGGDAEVEGCGRVGADGVFEDVGEGVVRLAVDGDLAAGDGGGEVARAEEHVGDFVVADAGEGVGEELW